MDIDKNQILEHLQSLGKHDEARKADKELPDRVDTDKHSDLLDNVGVNPQDLIGKLGDLLGH